ncbi:bifunctional protein tyrosine phosphatase family protein/NAD(P)/FAD-dependent oxidoreductase [Alteromonas sp. LMIT006]|uniref:bifunctional protein tyrosine phosphatase family protein/NAD(P)/FAD-dependent oxidoreductase n=1 Tax=Alteromonadaceae TaxID=72275 RepID=UPI0020CA8802|nr:bifunctional protein tyrosine phosphatase family protein/NAD(P)/FAD-dependent oxidoreductase [Alteromonas sp. LMIT006]UTP71809.1 bifunctional protein tyrosine phosphatase family protein/NAD(P)/FAD-dependent oxidoreductase [Alteromonas sp. LMIT006]
MDIKILTKDLSVSPQITIDDVRTLAEMGFKSLVCHRPDGEGADQVNFAEIQSIAEELGLQAVHQPVTSGKVTDEDAQTFKQLMSDLPKPMFAYCRTGTRCTTVWSLAQATEMSTVEILQTAKNAGYDMSGVVRRIVNGGVTPTQQTDREFDIVVVGAGAAGVAVCSSILARKPDVNIAVIDPADIHYYQPGWTMVGAGVFTPEQTVKTLSSLIPKGVTWIKNAVSAFEPDKNCVLLDGCHTVSYKHLIVCPGLKLDWHKIEGLSETLGKNGVTSNYRFDLAPYTWELVQGLQGGKAVFTQPPMPIKCAGAPQKAMYLSCDHWLSSGVLGKIDVEFYNAGPVLFGVKEYVPSLMKYVEKYQASLQFTHNLVKVDGPNKRAYFKQTGEGASDELVEVAFDMLHVAPPQSAPDFIKVSPLADEAGWVDVDQSTLQHKKYNNIYGLGDAMNAPNAKTAAAARVQAPIVANNVLCDMGLYEKRAIYNGYGSCPLTVEKGKIILAEFGYGGKMLPTFPNWLINGTQPSHLAWLLKEKILPPMYWEGMLKGKEWLVKPKEFLK